MDFGKLTQQASSFINNQNKSSNEAATGQNNDGNTNSAPANAPNTANTGNTGNEDYGDKALDFIEQKTGKTLSRETNEKITDGARGIFEKVAGKKVDQKWSN